MLAAGFLVISDTPARADCSGIADQATRNQCERDQSLNNAGSTSTPASGGCPGGGVRISIGLTGSNQCTPAEQNPIYAYAKGILGWLSGLVGVVVAIGYILAGYLWMTSAGNADRLKKAKTRLAQATISLVLFLFMVAILRYLVPGIFG